MKFEPLHYPDKIRVINPSGDVGRELARAENRLGEATPK
jgi:hypothetical protein